MIDHYGNPINQSVEWNAFQQPANPRENKEMVDILDKFLHQRIPRLSLLSKKRLSGVSIFNLGGDMATMSTTLIFLILLELIQSLFSPRCAKTNKYWTAGVDTGSMMRWTQGQFYGKVGCVFSYVTFLYKVVSTHRTGTHQWKKQLPTGYKSGFLS